MKAFMPMRIQIAKDFDKLNPTLVGVQDNVVEAIQSLKGAEDTLGPKSVIFQSLRRLEGIISSETSKLRDRPKRATKYAIYLKRVISTLKIGLERLADGSELEAYPTLSLIASHFLNIVLNSTLPSREPPRYIASNLSSFFKCLFSQDFEYVLDVIICSNTFDDADEKPENSENNVGFTLLKEICGDDYIYSRQTSLAANAKYLTVLAGLREAYQSKDEFREFYNNLDLDETVAVQSTLEDKFKMDFGKRKLNASELVEKIKTRKVANCIRRERQRVVIERKRKSLAIKETASTAQQRPLFYIDRDGSQVPTNFPDIEIQDVDEVQDDVVKNDNAQDAIVKNDNAQDAIVQNDNAIHVDNEYGYSQIFPDSSDDEETVVVGSRGASREAVPKQSKPDVESSDDENDDLKIVHEDLNPRRKKRNRVESERSSDDNTDNSEDSEDYESRDEAEAESGEDETPHYSDECEVEHEEVDQEVEQIFAVPPLPPPADSTTSSPRTNQFSPDISTAFNLAPARRPTATESENTEVVKLSPDSTSQESNSRRTRANSSSASELGSPKVADKRSNTRRSNKPKPLSPVAEVPLKREKREGKRKVPFTPPPVPIKRTNKATPAKKNINKKAKVEDVLPKKRGRPAKVVATPKKRGRPKKQDTTEAEASEVKKGKQTETEVVPEKKATARAPRKRAA